MTDADLHRELLATRAEIKDAETMISHLCKILQELVITEAELKRQLGIKPNYKQQLEK